MRILKTFLYSLILLKASLLQAQESPSDALIYGWYSWDPYQFEEELDGRRRIDGLDVQLLRALERDSGIPIEFRQEAWNRQIAKLKSGEQQLTIGFRTEERDDFVYYSQPFRKETNVLYLRRGEVDRFPFQSMEEFLQAVQSDFRLGVIDGYAYGPEAMRKFLARPDHRQHLVLAGSDIENFDNLFAGRIDGFLADRTVASTLAWRNGWQPLVEEHPFYFSREDIHILFSKASVTKARVDQFDRSLQNLRDSGEYQQIVQSYLFPVLLSITVSAPWFFIIDIIGTAAFAISGLVLARRGHYSLFGAFVLAALPAVGGGVIRDLLVGREPIGILRSPIYMLVILATVVSGYAMYKLHHYWINRPAYRGQQKRRVVTFAKNTVEVFDAMGLAAFTITGVVIAVETNVQPLWLWGPIFAVLTGAGGGIVRDVVRADVENPNLKGAFYPEVALIWGLILSFFIVWQNQRLVHEEIYAAVIITFIGAFLTRMAAVVFRIRSLMF